MKNKMARIIISAKKKMCPNFNKNFGSQWILRASHNNNNDDDSKGGQRKKIRSIAIIITHNTRKSKKKIPYRFCLFVTSFRKKNEFYDNINKL